MELDQTLQNHELWVGLNSKGMPYSTTEYDVLQLILDQSDSIGAEDILSIQRLATKNPMHVLYCANQRSKRDILNMVTLELAGREYELTDISAHKEQGFGKSSIRVSIHGIPFSVSDNELEQWVDSWANRTSRVRKAKAKTGDDHSQTTLLNGNRYCFVSAVTTPKPRYSHYPLADPLNPKHCIDIQITVYYDGQDINCRKCHESHNTKDCPTAPRQAAATLESNVVYFRGHHHPLSNYYPVDIVENDQTFASSEHYYQYTKAMSLGLLDEAENIVMAETAYKAMTLGNKLDDIVSVASRAEWDGERVQVMRRTLDLKYEYSTRFREYLHNTGDALLAEATSHPFWATGLPPPKARKLPPSEWPGNNQLGVLLIELRDKHSKSPIVLDDAAKLAGELIAHAMNSDDTVLSSPELLARTDRLLNSNTPTPTPPARKKRKNVLSPLANEAKRGVIPRIDTIFSKKNNTQ